MKKYGVDETPTTGQKTAAVLSKCPVCGKPLIKEGKVLLCPKHGSEPFESK